MQLRASAAPPVTRRELLFAGAAGLALSLPGATVVAQQRPGDVRKRTHDRIIHWVFDGGLSQEVWDPKPGAPSEISGPLDSIETSVPGVRFSSVSPELAKLAHLFTVVRAVQSPSVFHDASTHDLLWTADRRFYLAEHGRSAGSSVPVGLHVAPFEGKGDGLSWEFNRPRPMNDRVHVTPDKLDADWDGDHIVLRSCDVDAPRLERQLDLLDKLDATLQESPPVRQMQENHRLAVSILLGKGLRAGSASSKDIERFGDNVLGHAALAGLQMIEAGFGAVDIRCGHWDFHERIAELLQRRFPDADRAIAEQIRTIESSPELHGTVVVASTEFGRSPRINREAGRDHWEHAHAEIFYGGRFPKGKVVGSTTKSWDVTADPLPISEVKSVVTHAATRGPAVAPAAWKVFE